MKFSSLEVVKCILEKYLPVHGLNALRLASGRGTGKKYNAGLFEISYSLGWKENTFKS